jgi:hypothetical protein
LVEVNLSVVCITSSLELTPSFLRIKGIAAAAVAFYEEIMVPVYPVQMLPSVLHFVP